MQYLILRQTFTGELHTSQTTPFLSLIYIFSSTYNIMHITLRTEVQDGFLNLSFPYLHVQKKVCHMKRNSIKTPVSFTTRYMEHDMYIGYKYTYCP